MTVIRDKRFAGAALCVACVTAWMLASIVISGPAGAVLILLAWGGFVYAGWLSAWSMPFVVVAAPVGEVADLVGGDTDGELTYLGAAIVIAAPVGAALILAGFAVRAGRQFVQRRHSSTSSSP